MRVGSKVRKTETRRREEEDDMTGRSGGERVSGALSPPPTKQ